MYAKQSTAKTFIVGPILDADGVAKTDEVVASIKVTKNGTVGAPNGASTLTHDHTGNYKYLANAGDVDTLGEVVFSLNSGTNAMAPVRFQVLPANVYDSLVSGSDLLDANASQLGGTAQTGRDVGASVLLSAGSGAGQLDFTSGVVKSNLAQILGTALTETAGYIAAAFKKLFNVATPVLTAESVNQTGDSFGRIGAAGASLTAVGLAAAYDAAKTAAQAGDAMTLTAAYDAAKTAMRGTDSAALATVCTEGRLAELDAANLPTDVDAILADTGTDGVVVAAASKAGYGLADDAITSAKFDESTAFPLKSADTGSTQVARTGGDGDTLQILSNQLDGIAAGAPYGTGADTVTVTLLDDDGLPVADADLWVSTDTGQANIVAGPVQTDSNGQVPLYLDAGVTYYRWAQKDGTNFDNPQSFVASAD